MNIDSVISPKNQLGQGSPKISNRLKRKAKNISQGPAQNDNPVVDFYKGATIEQKDDGS